MPLKRNHHYKSRQPNKVSRMVNAALPHHRHHNVVNTTTANVGHTVTDVVSHPLSKVGNAIRRTKNKTTRVTHA